MRVCDISNIISYKVYTNPGFVNRSSRFWPSRSSFALGLHVNKGRILTVSLHSVWSFTFSTTAMQDTQFNQNSRSNFCARSLEMLVRLSKHHFFKFQSLFWYCILNWLTWKVLTDLPLQLFFWGNVLNMWMKLTHASKSLSKGKHIVELKPY